MKPVKTGVTLSATVVLFYTLCALVWLALPESFMDFVNTLFHGLDFRRLQSGHTLSWWSIILYPAFVFALWFFAAGAFFAWLHNMLGGED